MAKTNGPNCKFNRWVKEYGVQRLAHKIGIQRASVYFWLGGSVPKVEHLTQVIKISRGALTLEDILMRPTTRSSTKENRNGHRTRNTRSHR